MADPVSWVMIASAALGAISTVQQTQGARAEAQAEAQIDKVNAEAASAQAGQAEDAQRRRNREFLARQRAAIGEANIGFGGSAGLLQEQTAAELELEALDIRYEGELRRRGFNSQSDMARARKSSIGKSGFLSAAGTLLSGGADAYGAFSRVPKAA